MKTLSSSWYIAYLYANNGHSKAASVTLYVCACVCFLCRFHTQFQVWTNATYFTWSYVCWVLRLEQNWSAKSTHIYSIDKGWESSCAAMHLSFVSNTLCSLCNLYAEWEILSCQSKLSSMHWQVFAGMCVCWQIRLSVCLSVCQQVLAAVLMQHVRLRRHTFLRQNSCSSDQGSKQSFATMYVELSKVLWLCKARNDAKKHVQSPHQYTESDCLYVCLSVCMTVSFCCYFLSVQQTWGLACWGAC